MCFGVDNDWQVLFVCECIGLGNCIFGQYVFGIVGDDQGVGIVQGGGQVGYYVCDDVVWLVVDIFFIDVQYLLVFGDIVIFYCCVYVGIDGQGCVQFVFGFDCCL